MDAEHESGVGAVIDASAAVLDSQMEHVAATWTTKLALAKACRTDPAWIDHIANGESKNDSQCHQPYNSKDDEDSDNDDMAWPKPYDTRRLKLSHRTIQCSSPLAGARCFCRSNDDDCKAAYSCRRMTLVGAQHFMVCIDHTVASAHVQPRHACDSRRLAP